MKILKSHFILLGGLGAALTLLPSKALAFCPLCVVATGAFTGVFRWLGVDDAIIGLWLGGFTLSVSMLFNNFLIKRGKKIKFQLVLVLLFFYGFTVLSLIWLGVPNPYNKIFGFDKIFFGLFLGSLLLMLAPYLDRFLRKQNQGRKLISHQ